MPKVVPHVRHNLEACFCSCFCCCFAAASGCCCFGVSRLDDSRVQWCSGVLTLLMLSTPTSRSNKAAVGRKYLLQKDIHYIGVHSSQLDTDNSIFSPSPSAQAGYFTSMEKLDTAVSRRMWASSLISALPSFLFG